MRTVQEVYSEYRIMPILQMHQLRVASTAKMIIDSFQDPINKEDILLTCLFHDMGNIIKAKFDQLAGLFKDDSERAHWEKVKEEYIQKYGADEHHANLTIAADLGLSEEVRGYMDRISFAFLSATRDGSSYEQKICQYADLRAGPYGILSLEDRMQDIHDRYSGRNHPAVPENPAEFEELRESARILEKQIFTKTAIRPEDINDESVAPFIKELSNYHIA